MPRARRRSVGGADRRRRRRHRGAGDEGGGRGWRHRRLDQQRRRLPHGQDRRGPPRRAGARPRREPARRPARRASGGASHETAAARRHHQRRVAGRARAVWARGVVCGVDGGGRALGEALRQGLVGTGVQVVTVYPESVDTPLFQHAANYTGKGIRAMPPILSPERVARAIVHAIEVPRGEIAVGGATRRRSSARCIFSDGRRRRPTGRSSGRAVRRRCAAVGVVRRRAGWRSAASARWRSRGWSRSVADAA